MPPLPPLSRHLRHTARSVLTAGVVVAASLGIGAAGYHLFERLPWLDSELNAAMILTGMGPLHHPATVGGKVFVSAYALFSGLVFISMAALILAPTARRVLHRMHLDLHATTTTTATATTPHQSSASSVQSSPR